MHTQWEFLGKNNTQSSLTREDMEGECEWLNSAKTEDIALCVNKLAMSKQTRYIDAGEIGHWRCIRSNNTYRSIITSKTIGNQNENQT